MAKQASAAATQAGSSEHRRVERDLVDLTTKLLTPRGRQSHVRLVDISPHGFMVRTIDSFEAGDTVRLRLPMFGEVAGRAIWSLGGRLGCEFLEEIPPADYAVLLAAIRTARPGWRLG